MRIGLNKLPVFGLLTMVVLLLSIVNTISSATYFSIASGNWSNTGSVWSATSGGVVVASFPHAGDVVTIEKGFTVIVDLNNEACTSIFVGSANAGNCTLTFAAGSQLTVSTAVTLGNGVHTGSLDFSAGGLLQIGTVFTVTNLGAFTQGSGTVEYNGNVAQTVPAGIATYANLTCSGNGAKSFSAGCTVSGTFTISSAVTVNLNTGTTLNKFYFNNYSQTSAGSTLNGGTANDASSGYNSEIFFTGSFNNAGGTITNNSPSDYTLFIFNGGATQTFSSTGSNFEYASVWIQNNTTLTLNSDLAYNDATGSTIFVTVDQGSTLIAGTKIISISGGGALSVNINGIIASANTTAAGGFSGAVGSTISSTNAPAITLGSSSTVIYNGASAQFVSVLAYANLTLANSSGGASTLAGATTVSGTLTMTSGILTTSVAKTILITNTASSAITGGSTTSFVNGPLTWSLPANLSLSASVYFFPIGAVGTYYPFSLTSLTTGATGPVLTMQSFNAGTGGTGDGTTITNASITGGTEYWQMIIVSGNYTSGSVSLTRQAALGTLNVVANSPTKGGIYTSVYGTVSGTSVLNSGLTGNSNLFFALATGIACAAPGTQAHGITFGVITGQTIAISSWTNGTGVGRIVVVQQGSAPAAPANGIFYTANSVFGLGSTTAPGSFVAYQGVGTAVTLSGLSPSLTYYFEVFEYNCGGGLTQYLTSGAAGNPNNTSTLACAAPSTNASAIVFAGTTCSTATVSWTNGNGTNRIVHMNSINSFTAPVNGTTYAANSVYAAGEQVVYNGSGNSVTVSGTSNPTTYFFKVYEYNCSGANTMYSAGSAVASNAAGALTAIAWKGSGVTGGTGNGNFNSSTNWNPNTAPGTCTDLTMTTNANGSSVLSGSVSIHNLTMSNSGGGIAFALDVSTFALTINGTFSGSNTGTGSNSIEVGNAPGTITYLGSATYGATTGNFFAIEGDPTSSGTIKYEGNVTFNAGTNTPVAADIPAEVIFDAPVSQSVTDNSANTISMGSASVEIGQTNNPVVTFAGAGTGVIEPLLNLNINGTSILDLGTRTANLPALAFSGGIDLASGANLKLGAGAGGATGSNFPINYSLITLNPGSTVEYNSISTINQTVFNECTYGNLILANGSGSGTTTKTAGGALTLIGNLTIPDAFTSFAAGTFIHSLTGNWINNGTFIANSGTIMFNGTSATAQSLGGTTATTFNNLTVNNTGTGGVTQNTAATVSNVYNAQSGAFNLNSLTLTIGTSPSAGSDIISNAGYILSETNVAVNPSVLQWNIGTDLSAHVFPFGTAAGVLIPVTFQGSGAGCGNISISTRPTGSDNTPFAGASNGGTVPAVSNMIDFITGTDGSVNYVIDRWWDIQSSLASPIPAVALSVSYVGSENTMSTPGTTLGMQHWTGTYWNDGKGGIGGTSLSTGSAGGSAAGTAYTVSVSGVTNFSPIILVDLTHPLPIELLYFDAYCVSGTIKLTWSTATETNNDYFTLEKSLDAVNFSSIGTIKGAGNSSVEKMYQTTDSAVPESGVIYYRLKQTDYDGKFTYSAIIMADCFNSTGTMKIFPNPSHGDHFNVSFSNLGNRKSVLLVLVNMLGETVYSEVIISDDNGSVVVEVVPPSHLPAGIYTVTGSTDNKLYNQRLIVK